MYYIECLIVVCGVEPTKEALASQPIAKWHLSQRRSWVLGEWRVGIALVPTDINNNKNN